MSSQQQQQQQDSTQVQPKRTTKLAPPGTGSNPPQHKYQKILSNGEKDDRTIPVPWWFIPQSAELFQNLQLHEDDVIVSSGVKMGTTWMNRILTLLLHEVDSNGDFIHHQEVQTDNTNVEVEEGVGDGGKDGKHKGGEDSIPNRMGQTYPDSCYATREEHETDPLGIFDRVPNGRERRAAIFGDFVLEDLVGQPRPRMFTTHLFGRRYLPKMLFDGWSLENDSGDGSGDAVVGGGGDGNGASNNNEESNTKNSNHSGNKGKGRLILVLRNTKDTLSSLHHFRGTPADGWNGNEYGPGSFRRFIDVDDCPNAMGSPFLWIKENAEAVEAINNSGRSNAEDDYDGENAIGENPRALVVYYEALIQNFHSQLHRINDFLDLPPLTRAKSRAIEEACTLKSMSASSLGRFKQTTRKGGIGDWKSHLTQDQWSEFDGVFNDVLNGVTIVEPLRFFQWKDVRGMPPLKCPGRCSDEEKCGGCLDVDPREWEGYPLVQLREGMIVPDEDFSGVVEFMMDRVSKSCPETQFRFPFWYWRTEEITARMKCLEILKGLRNHEHGWFFVNPVDPEELGLFDYFDIIKKPMDLGTIQQKLVGGKYGAFEEFKSDVVLTFRNAMTYCQKEEVVHKMADDLRKKFDVDYENMLKNLYETDNSCFNLKDVMADGSPRYHLFVAASDALASAVMSARHLLGLENKVSMDVSDGQSGSGWVFLNGASCLPWKERGEEESFWLYEAYQLADPLCTTKISVPVLWDSVREKIVSNDSWEIMKLLSDSSTALEPVSFPTNVTDLIGNNGTSKKPTLYPEGAKEEVEKVHNELTLPLLDGIEKSGVEYLKSGQIASADVLAARKDVFLKLKKLEDLLRLRRFSTGDKVTASDVCLASCLLQFDSAYLDAYSLRDAIECKGSILLGDSYPNLKAFLRDMYTLLQPSIHFGSSRHHFRLYKAIETTRQLYSRGPNGASAVTCIYNELPNLHEIVESIKQPAGARPSARFIHGVPIPFWFRHDTFGLFRDLDLRNDDIILSSGVKMGTTWVTKIINSLLHDFDDDGNTTPIYMDDSFPNRLGQTYPDALFPSREVLRREMADLIASMPEGREPLASNFGDFVFEDLVNQPTPRLFSTHLFGKKLIPKKLFDGWDADGEGIIFNGPADQGKKGKGRLIIVVRNLKDTLASLHFFRGEPKDGWDGNEHGPGSFRRFIDLENCPNAYGDSFNWIKSSAEAVDAVGSKRALVIYYEALKSNFDVQLRRINDFLGLPPLSEAKAHAVSDACSATKMRTETGGRFKYAIRKGQVGDWANYLDEERWSQLDQVFNESLGGVALAEPLRFFQYKEIPGMPLLPLNDCDFDTDPRTWTPYLIATLREGMVVVDPDILHNTNPIPSAFSSTYSSMESHLNLEETCSDGTPRYHLFVAASDPVTSPIIAAHKLLGLEDKVSMDISDGQSSAGWVFLNGASCSPWKEREGNFWLYEAYQLADPLCTTKNSAPVLWDAVSEKIVSNDSWGIMQLLSSGSNGATSLFPEESKMEMETLFSECLCPLFDAVFKAGLDYFRNGQKETKTVLQARSTALSLVEKLEEQLDSTRFLLRDEMTGLDLYLSFFLFQFDASYLDAFVLRSVFKDPILSGGCYPNLTSYARGMFGQLKSTVHFESYRQIFRIGPSILLTRQLCCPDAKDDDDLDALADLSMPDLKDISASLNLPPGVRPGSKV